MHRNLLWRNFQHKRNAVCAVPLGVIHIWQKYKRSFAYIADIQLAAANHLLDYAVDSVNVIAEHFCACGGKLVARYAGIPVSQIMPQNILNSR